MILKLSDKRQSIIASTIEALDRGLDELVQNRVAEYVKQHINADSVLKQAVEQAKRDVNQRTISDIVKTSLTKHCPNFSSVMLSELIAVTEIAPFINSLMLNVCEASSFSLKSFHVRRTLIADIRSIDDNFVSTWMNVIDSFIEEVGPAIEDWYLQAGSPKKLLSLGYADEPILIQYVGIDPTNGIQERVAIDWAIAIPVE